MYICTKNRKSQLQRWLMTAFLLQVRIVGSLSSAIISVSWEMVSINWVFSSPRRMSLFVCMIILQTKNKNVLRHSHMERKRWSHMERKSVGKREVEKNPIKQKEHVCRWKWKWCIHRTKATSIHNRSGRQKFTHCILEECRKIQKSRTNFFNKQ